MTRPTQMPPMEAITTPAVKIAIQLHTKKKIPFEAIRPFADWLSEQSANNEDHLMQIAVKRARTLWTA